MYKATYKQYTPGHTMTDFGLEIIIHGEHQDIIEDRLNEAIYDMSIGSNNFKLIRLEKT